jgi:hypothetical protein
MNIKIWTNKYKYGDDEYKIFFYNKANNTFVLL